MSYDVLPAAFEARLAVFQALQIPLEALSFLRGPPSSHGGPAPSEVLLAITEALQLPPRPSHCSAVL